MSRFAGLLAATLLALSAFATPTVAADDLPKLQITRRVKPSSASAPLKLVEADRARIAHYKSQSAARAKGATFPHRKAAHLSKHGSNLRSRAASVIATNDQVAYTATVTIGSQGPYTLLVDTGSSNTFVGLDKPYEPTSCNDRFYVSYGSGQVLGLECTDSIALASGLTVQNQGVGVALRSQGFEGQGIDGILGVGPADLTVGTTEFNGGIIPTVTDNLARQGTISSEALGVFFAPSTSESSANGELTFGGSDLSRHNSSIRYTPVTSTSPASAYWGINQTISYGGKTILSNTAGIVDTGTTLLYIATDAFERYQQATGAVLDPTTGLLAIQPSQYSSLQPLTLNVASAGSYTLSPNAQIWPRSLNADIGGNSSFIYLVVNDAGENSGSGLDFINGFAFLERFYTVFDTANKRVGFASTAFTNATTN